MRTSPGFRWLNPRRCWMNSGSTQHVTNTPGLINGSPATWCYGTIAAPCTGATRLNRPRAGFCTALRSRARRALPRDDRPTTFEANASEARVERSPDGSGAALPDVHDPLYQSGQHLDDRAADEDRSGA